MNSRPEILVYEMKIYCCAPFYTFWVNRMLPSCSILTLVVSERVILGLQHVTQRCLRLLFDIVC